MDYCLMMELKRKATAARTHNGTYGRNAFDTAVSYDALVALKKELLK